jgi:hypothetical protein
VGKLKATVVVAAAAEMRLDARPPVMVAEAEVEKAPGGVAPLMIYPFF